MEVKEKLKALADLVGAYEMDYVLELKENEEWATKFLDLIKDALVKSTNAEFKMHMDELNRRQNEFNEFKRQLAEKHGHVTFEKLLPDMTAIECVEYQYKSKRLNDLTCKVARLKAKLETIRNAW